MTDTDTTSAPRIAVQTGGGALPDAQQAASVEGRLEALLEEYGPWLERTVRRICPQHLGIDPAEVHQQTVLRLWKALESEKEIGKPASYLYRIVSTVTIDAIRASRRRSETSLEGDGLPEHEGQHEAVALHQPSPHRLAESHQKGEALNRALMSLSENRRRAVTLQLHGFTTPETARLLGWSEAKVRNLAWRGIQDLKQLLRDQGVDS